MNVRSNGNGNRNVRSNGNRNGNGNGNVRRNGNGYDVVSILSKAWIVNLIVFLIYSIGIHKRCKENCDTSKNINNTLLYMLIFLTFVGMIMMMVSGTKNSDPFIAYYALQLMMKPFVLFLDFLGSFLNES